VQAIQTPANKAVWVTTRESSLKPDFAGKTAEFVLLTSLRPNKNTSIDKYQCTLEAKFAFFCDGENPSPSTRHT
jgi:hypothetical protein